jgi:isoleucyl-tRNA synthetase
MFSTPGPLDFVAMAGKTRAFWEREHVFAQLVAKNRGGPRFSFLDGPITANNPMGVHHARGRTYKDIVQRYKAMGGFEQRFQNGFDCQGLWVEVEVEKALGLNSKREIEAMGHAAFARACRERVLCFAALQTEQSKRLGQWMDWPHSYYTMSDANIGYIWHFLQECHRRSWIYSGHRVMPWCVRCGTSISQHEMLESYADVTHQSVVVAFPILGQERTALLAWTTTPWTLPANVAVAVHPDAAYESVAVGDWRYWVAAAARPSLPGLGDVQQRVKGTDLVGLHYVAPFSDLPVQRSIEHRVVGWDDVAAREGTGIVHIAPGCGQNDFELGQRYGLPIVAAIDEEGRYGPGFGEMEHRSVFEATADVVRRLRTEGRLYHEATHRHRYPSCWRCGHQLIFRLVDEWFIRADELRPRALRANAGVSWHPEHMGLRMKDWLTNMGDWCISRKRVWGLPLPFYPCTTCGRLTVVGSPDELRRLAIDPAVATALPELHRPWIDEVTLKCPGCGSEVPRVPEVGDCWLDAGIVPFSTLGYLDDRARWAQWFPADFVVEMAAQVRGWFYALLFMAVTLEDRAPYRTVMAHDRVLGEDGREMHKSWGNAVWLDEALDRVGPDVVRYLFASHAVAEPIAFGSAAARDVTRRFLTLWNIYTLFVTYANIDQPALPSDAAAPEVPLGLEAWILARLESTIREVRAALDGYQLRRAVRALEDFIQDDVSNWYVRRRRRLFWKGEMTEHKTVAYQTLFHVLVRICQLLAPVTPFVAEHIYQGLLGERSAGAVRSVHLTDFPGSEAESAARVAWMAPTSPSYTPQELEAGVAFVRRALTVGLALRNAAGLRVRQPVARVLVLGPPGQVFWLREFEADLREELNAEAVDVEPIERAVADALRADGRALWTPPGRTSIALAVDAGPFRAVLEGDLIVAVDTHLTPALRRKGLSRQLAHQIQRLRKGTGLNVDDRIRVYVSSDPERQSAIEEHSEYLCAETLAVELAIGPPPSGIVVHTVELEGGLAAVGIARAAAAGPPCYDAGRQSQSVEEG